MPERAASILNPSPPAEEEENLGGSIRVNGDAVRRRLRIPTRFRVGDRPAGAESGEDLVMEEVLSLGRGERAGRIERRGEEISAEEVEAGALGVRK